MRFKNWSVTKEKTGKNSDKKYAQRTDSSLTKMIRQNSDEKSTSSISERLTTMHHQSGNLFTILSLKFFYKFALLRGLFNKSVTFRKMVLLS